MDTEQITLDREVARKLYQDYRKHQHYSEPIDREVMSTYRALSQGRVVIQALASIIKAGVGPDGLPRLALVRANAKACYLKRDGSRLIFAATATALYRASQTRQRIELPAGDFPGLKTELYRQQAIVPQVPLPLRPKRGLANYHILFEAEWKMIPPKDPLLLRHAGKGDLWIVCASWDLSPVERAALAARIRVN